MRRQSKQCARALVATVLVMAASAFPKGVLVYLALRAALIGLSWRWPSVCLEEKVSAFWLG
jgi:hypothetical protein